MNVELDLPVGKWRYISEDEMTVLYKLLSDSTKTHF
jgi:23S rRNA pseudouridine2604 synthase